jgi:hypothetical protein
MTHDAHFFWTWTTDGFQKKTLDASRESADQLVYIDGWMFQVAKMASTFAEYQYSEDPENDPFAAPQKLHW